MKKKLPVGKQNFKQIIEQGYLYIDKTREVYNLISGSSLYFFSRPRRFGKTLLVSMLGELFKGNKELFKGLYIYDVDYNWEKYPIIDIGFADFDYNTNWQMALSLHLEVIAKNYEVELPKLEPSIQFKLLIEALYAKYGQVVILIDEYDKPIITFIEDSVKAIKKREFLKGFFASLKGAERRGMIRFLLITGVSKFSKVSIFSELNNLTDITLNPMSASLVGITNKELHHYFGEDITEIAEKFDIPRAELLEDIKTWYNGYSWDGKTFVYNPFGLLQFFRDQDFNSYWFATGTPTFLVKQIHKKRIALGELENRKEDDSFFEKFRLSELNIPFLLFQTGYLTIKSITRNRRKSWRKEYVLGYPNREVKEAFLKNLLEEYSAKTQGGIGATIWDIQDPLFEGNVGAFVKGFETLFADISYHLFPKNRTDEQAVFVAWEGYYQSVIYIVLSLIGIDVECEITTNKGRIDAVINMENYIYIIEFKMGTAEEAMEQIKERKYYQKFQQSEKEIILLGIGFDREQRNISAWLKEIWKE